MMNHHEPQNITIAVGLSQAPHVPHVPHVLHLLNVPQIYVLHIYIYNYMYWYIYIYHIYIYNTYIYIYTFFIINPSKETLFISSARPSMSTRLFPFGLEESRFLLDLEPTHVGYQKVSTIKCWR